MRPASRKAASSVEQRRIRLSVDRGAAPPLRTVFPRIEHLSMELRFIDGTPHAPSQQLHTLYPAAQAFFRFACPCLDCDGEFDLSEPVSRLAAERTKGKPRGSRSASDQLPCSGVRWRDRPNSLPCSIKLQYRLSIRSGG